MAGEPPDLEADLTPVRAEREGRIGRESPRGGAILQSLRQGPQGVPGQSLHIRGVPHWAAGMACPWSPIPCPTLAWEKPRGSSAQPGVLWQIQGEAAGGCQSNMLPRWRFWKGDLSSGLHGHHKGIRGSLWVQKCMFFVLLFSSILISATLLPV